jgi:hypothetical protein
MKTMKAREGRAISKKVGKRRGSSRIVQIWAAEGRTRNRGNSANRKVEESGGKSNPVKKRGGRDHGSRGRNTANGKLDTTFSSFASAVRAESIFEVVIGESRSGKVKMAWKNRGFKPDFLTGSENENIMIS